ncbi:CPBP family intramembrane glutamic endopeptidase [Agrococcus sp. TF02-05]|uniref:CPBP family intramembrane glutamic endopeptidase n=1 Tax=Agrococcus sp. TF02-05 TaxID=2815211 RepID=UPI001AA0F6DA|nr:CPBP family intramembrane glutamic endopeptidase [Agrococcus sp. TF02-05]MBO1770424.1 CPBP family intramembrane metalloprotease [Agrococcus sp. TF02-05]
MHRPSSSDPISFAAPIRQERPAPARVVATFLLIVFGWSMVVGAGLHLTRTPLDSVTGIVVLGALLMPSPLVAAVIAERGIRRERLRLPRRSTRPVLVFLLAPVVAVLAFVVLYAGIQLLLGNAFGIPGVGGLATTDAELVAGAERLLGQAAADAAGTPPPLAALLLVSVLGAILAGWTVNGLVGLGEEYGWRGLLWDALRHLGAVRANLVIGTVWGLWHAPVILQGYNYGDPLLGVPAMVLFCIAMSFVLSAIREATASVLPVAAAHGIFNALAPMLLIAAPDAVPALGGPLGLLGAAVLAGVGAAAWGWHRSPSGAATAAPAPQSLDA